MHIANYNLWCRNYDAIVEQKRLAAQAAHETHTATARPDQA